MYDLMSSTVPLNLMGSTINTGNEINGNHNPSSIASNQNTLSKQHAAAVNPKAAKIMADYKQIILELRAQNFDVIRFATYRTASKLRFIQKKLNLHLIDLWNVIETFRDNNIHTVDLLYELDLTRLDSCVRNMYVELNKRLAFNQHINVDSQTQLLTAWLLNLYDKSRLNRIKVISLKVALTTMCAGKLTDKLKYMFNQISDPNKNCLIVPKFELYLKELLQLPTSVFEEPSFGYNDSVSRGCFDLVSPVYINDFLDVALSDLGPACFIWLNIFHRFTIVQNVSHPVACSVCARTHFNGFRYKCQKCRKYQLCQDCFWRGRVSRPHQLTHQMKEYTSYKSAAKSFSNSLKKSFFCKPNNSKTTRQQQQELQQQERQAMLLVQKPVETTSPSQEQHQLSYQNQYDYEKALLNQNQYHNHSSNEINIIHDSNFSNSDQSLLYRQPEVKFTNGGTNNNSNNHLNGYLTDTNNNNVDASSYHNGNGSYSATSTLNRKPKAQNIYASKLGVNSNHNNINEATYSEALNPLQKTIDFQITHPSNQLNNTNNNIQLEPGQLSYQQQVSSLKKRNNSNISAPLYSSMMTKQATGKQLDAIAACPKLLAKLLLNNSNNGAEPLSQDEHSLIANYSQLLAEFYAKNPNLASNSTPTTPDNIPSMSQKLKPNLKTAKVTTIYDTTGSSSSYRQSQPMDSAHLQRMSNRTSSLQRQSGLNSTNRLRSPSQLNHYTSQSSTLSNHYSKNYANNNTSSLYTKTNGQPIMLAPNTTRSISESNFRTNTDLNYNFNDITDKDNGDYPEEFLLKEKREIVAKLERQNKEIINEINRLKLQASNRSLDKQADDITSTKEAWALQQQQQRLKSRESTPVNMMSTLRKNMHDTALISQLLSQNPALRSMLCKQLGSTSMTNPQLIAELQSLKNKKGMLENRMSALENSKLELMTRLSQLDTATGVCGRYESPSQSKRNKIYSNSLRTTPASSPRPGSSHSRHATPSADNMMVAGDVYNSSQAFIPITSASPGPQRSGIITNLNGLQQQRQQRESSLPLAGSYGTQPRSWSTPNTPALHELHPRSRKQQQMGCSATSLNSMTSGISSATSTGNGSTNSLNTSNLKSLRNDLLIAADSVTNAMQGLVRELNSEVESNDEDDSTTTAHGGNNTNKLQRLPVNAWDNETYSSHAGLLAATGVANVGLGEEEDEDEEAEADLNTVLSNNKKILSMEKFMSQRYQMRSPYSTLSMPTNNNQQMPGVAMTTTTTPTAPNVLFRKNSQDTTTRLLQRQIMLNGSMNNTPNKINSNGYRNGINLDELENSEQTDTNINQLQSECFDGEEEDMDDTHFTESFMDESRFEANVSLDAQSLQEQFELQQQEQLRAQQEIEFENRLLAENLSTDTNEQVAEWRRELEQRLMDDGSNANEVVADANAGDVSTERAEAVALIDSKEILVETNVEGDQNNNELDKKSVDLNNKETEQ